MLFIFFISFILLIYSRAHKKQPYKPVPVINEKEPKRLRKIEKHNIESINKQQLR